MSNQKLIHGVDPRYKDTFDEVAIGLAHVDLTGKFIRINDFLCEFLGYSRNELLNLTFQELTLPEDIEDSLIWIKASLAGEIKTPFNKVKRYKHKDNKLVWAQLTTTLMRDSSGKPAYFISSIQDIADLKAIEIALDESVKKLSEANKELKRLSRQDNLTGLLNFKAFSEHLVDSFQRYQRNQTPVSFIFIDVDKFKRINDRHGHLVGDCMLQQVATTLKSNARDIDFVARYGGDEFSVLLTGSTAEEAQQYCNRVGKEVALTLDDGTVIKVGLSYGICELKSEFSSVDKWLEESDRLMYQDKA